MKKNRYKVCLKCGKEFYQPYNVGITAWNKRRYCSRECFNPLRSVYRHKKCIDCGKEFFCQLYIGIGAWKKRKYCSEKCGNLSREFKKGHRAWNKEKHHSLNTIKKMSGSNSVHWKGEDVGYMALHEWVRKELGQPDTCEHCRIKGVGRKMHWANKDHKYKRNTKDWLRLCPKCHKKHDIRNELRI